MVRTSSQAAFAGHLVVGRCLNKGTVSSALAGVLSVGVTLVGSAAALVGCRARKCGRRSGGTDQRKPLCRRDWGSGHAPLWQRLPGAPLILRAVAWLPRVARNALSARGSWTAMGDDEWELNISERERVVLYGSVVRL